MKGSDSRRSREQLSEGDRQRPSRGAIADLEQKLASAPQPDTKLRRSKKNSAPLAHEEKLQIST
ncbi:hypothetical protein IGI04_040680 [Brassica rapa subsp. trilocularis]|uniref:Uncharacterized protein n=1 Tax=Brassica rapa subsp. trilocularis TaxID=1813537 RepID=A0ABQ7KPC1_BRACM|nr:hypothetical protein IGI04_040680 [Brassica rapa subsp. trilocularis]